MTDEHAIIISTHQVRDVDRLLDRVIIMDDSQVLLNRRVDEITSRLKFFNTDSREIIKSALYAQPSLEGTNVVLVNDDDSETELNLESLFELSLLKGSLLKEMFNR